MFELKFVIAGYSFVLKHGDVTQDFANFGKLEDRNVSALKVE